LVPIGLYRLNSTKFCELILRKINKTVASRCQILRQKCTKSDFEWDSATGTIEALNVGRNALKKKCRFSVFTKTQMKCGGQARSEIP